jgi:aerobic carbon-monoxide dehydrogenase medium subunit
MTGSFSIAQPETLEEALELLADGDESVRPLGGGSGLTLLMRYGFFEPSLLVSLRRLEELRRVEVTGEGALRLGALTTLRDLERDPLVAQRAPMLHSALQRLATVRLRNVAQLGGAIAHGHPQMDLPPVLLALGAQVKAESRRGTRWITADDLFRGYYETSIADDELVTEVSIPELAGQRGTYRKVTARTVDDWPMLGVAVVATGSDVRVALGAVTDRAVRLADAEAALDTVERTQEELRAVAAEAAASVPLHDRPAASATYQRQRLEIELFRAFADTLIHDGDQPAGEGQEGH